MQRGSPSDEESASIDDAIARKCSRKRKRPQRYVDAAREEDESAEEGMDVDDGDDLKSGSVSPAAGTNGAEAGSDTEAAERELPEEALRATLQGDFARVVKPWLAKTVAGLEGRQLDEAVSERWGQLVAQRLANQSSSSRPSRASREKAIRDIAIGAEFEKASGRKRFFEEEEYTSQRKDKRVAKHKAVLELRAKARAKSKASESDSMGSDSESDVEHVPRVKRKHGSGSSKSKSKAKKAKSSSAAPSAPSSVAGSDGSASASELESEDDYDEFCKVCHEGGDLLCCDGCPCTYHMACLNPPLTDVPELTWNCPRCLAEPLKDKVGRILTWRWLDPPNAPLTEEEEANGVEPHPVKGAKRIRQFLVKYSNMSYLDCEWVNELQLDVHAIHQYRATKQKMQREDCWLEPPGPHDPDNIVKGDTLEVALFNCGVPADWLIPQRIVKHRRGQEDSRNYLVKWREIGYEYCTWESANVHSDIPRLLEKYNDVRAFSDPTFWKKKDRKKRDKLLPHSKSVKMCSTKYEQQPDCLTGTLHPYQLEGLNWLRFSWAQGTNTILADEMGLGKTIQTIAFLYSLVKEGHCQGPFLISAPLSTLINWERECELWAPDLYAITYIGPQDARKVLRNYEFSFDEDAVKRGNKVHRFKSSGPVKFHVLLTSYEMVNIDKSLLQSIDWEVLVIDEAHRLKNNKSLFFKVMSGYNIKYKLLLTGTPLQNNLEELYHLLNFLSPDSFCDMNFFLEEFQDISKEEQVMKLHDLLGPHLLRRLKADVLKSMPTKTELLVRVDLAPLQKTVYRSILTRNFDALNSRRGASGGGGGQVTLLNVMMDLKKCCNHPFLFPAPAEEAAHNKHGGYEGRGLIEACGKFTLLEKMLDRLKKDGHRVLIFSQMTRVLDLLEDFLDYKEYSYERIDGAISGGCRQMAIDRFNAPGASGFVFLLSTRAGGLGINLATADTVIIYDSDWNPHNDIQALSRAHRIGQQKTVMIYRFVTRSSVEERVTEVAKRKMMLTHMVVRPGLGGNSTAQFTKKEMDDILRFGTQQLFADEDEKDGGKDEDGSGSAKDTGHIVYDDEMLTKLLDRSQQSNVTEEKDGLNEYFSAFKMASFTIKETQEPQPNVEVVKEEDVQVDNNYWEKLLRHHFEQIVEEEQGQMGKGKRQRKAVNYMDGFQESYDRTNTSKQEDPDASFSNEESSQDEEEDTGDKPNAVGLRKRIRKPVRPVDAAPPPLMAYVDKNLEVLGFNMRHRRAFQNYVLRFGLPHTMSFDWLPAAIRKRKPESHIKAYMNLFLRHLCEPAGKESTFSDGVPRENLNSEIVLNRIGIMKLVRQKVYSYKSTNGTCSKPLAVASDRTATSLSSVTSNDDKPALSTTVSTGTDNAEAASAETKQEGGSEKKPEPSGDVAAQETTAEPKKQESSDCAAEMNGAAAPAKPPSPAPVQKFMFNIADGGFTELHARWAKERSGPTPPLSVIALMTDETDIIVERRWGRRHDYWMLYGVVEHGYAKWQEILADPNLAILSDALHEVAYENRIRYLSRRMKLLEQALLIEEQLKKAHSQNLVQDPKHPVMALNQKFAELEAIVESNQHLVQPVMVRNKSSNRVLLAALVRMDELLIELRGEVTRLPNLLQSLPPISQRLGLSQESIIRQAIQPSGQAQATPAKPHAPAAKPHASAAAHTTPGPHVRQDKLASSSSAPLMAGRGPSPLAKAPVPAAADLSAGRSVEVKKASASDTVPVLRQASTSFLHASAAAGPGAPKAKSPGLVAASGRPTVITQPLLLPKPPVASIIKAPAAGADARRPSASPPPLIPKPAGPAPVASHSTPPSGTAAATHGPAVPARGPSPRPTAAAPPAPASGSSSSKQVIVIED